MEFEQMLHSDLLKLWWLRDKRPIMNSDEKLLYDFLITQKKLNENQQELLTEMYERVKLDYESPTDFKCGIYQIETNESCGYSNAI